MSSTVGQDSDFPVFRCDLSGETRIMEVKAATSEVDVPWVGSFNVQQMLDETFVRLNLLVFRAAFSKEKAKKKDVKKLTKAAKVREDLLSMCFTREAQACLCSEAALSEPQVFGVRGRGTQQGLPLWGVGTLWATAVPSSSRLAGSVMHSWLLQQNSGSKGEQPSYPAIVSYVRNLSPDSIRGKGW